jgi:hypothetical protein
LKIISFDNARATWLFPLEEFTPLAGADGRALLAAIAVRYGFTRLPAITTREDMAKNGLQFGVGQFEIDGARANIPDFIVYNDGIVAMAEKTEWADKFLEDVVQWVKEEFGFRDFSSGIRKLYASTLIVDFETPLSRLLRGYELISELISSRTITIMPSRKPLQFSRLDFEVDKTEMEGQLALPKFVLERRSGVLFSQERYYTVAPMHTASHIEVLTEIERLASE